MKLRYIIEFSKKLKVMEVKVGGKIVRFLSQNLNGIESKIFKVYDIKIGN